MAGQAVAIVVLMQNEASILPTLLAVNGRSGIPDPVRNVGFNRP